jgi:aminoglycoside phosphotransferase (APT) family kinase protein
MPLSLEELERYLASIHGAGVSIISVRELGRAGGGIEPEELKGFGYGTPYLIEFSVRGERRSAVLETMRAEGFGHEHLADRLQCLSLAHSTYNKLPRHARAIDLGYFARGGAMRSIGDIEEPFLLVERVEGSEYYRDLERIRDGGALGPLDLTRCDALSGYLAEIHSVKGDSPGLYARRIRELVGHGECIMGLLDSYPADSGFASARELEEIERMCVGWRWKLKGKAHRLCQVHGDFHPWNVLFREGADFSVLDRSRGEWGEAADDVAAMDINYLFFSLQAHGRLEGAFMELHERFMRGYLDLTGDEELLRVIQPFYAWRALVVASPIWYPTISADIRRRLFNFIRNVLSIDEVDVGDFNSYLR